MAVQEPTELFYCIIHNIYDIWWEEAIILRRRVYNSVNMRRASCLPE